jgi:hypothetical protein
VSSPCSQRCRALMTCRLKARVGSISPWLGEIPVVARSQAETRVVFSELLVEATGERNARVGQHVDLPIGVDPQGHHRRDATTELPRHGFVVRYAIGAVHLPNDEVPVGKCSGRHSARRSLEGATCSFPLVTTHGEETRLIRMFV